MITSGRQQDAQLIWKSFWSHLQTIKHLLKNWWSRSVKSRISNIHRLLQIPPKISEHVGYLFPPAVYAHHPVDHRMQQKKWEIKLIRATGPFTGNHMESHGPTVDDFSVPIGRLHEFKVHTHTRNYLFGKRFHCGDWSSESRGKRGKYQ